MRLSLVGLLALLLVAGCAGGNESAPPVDATPQAPIGMVDGLTAAESRWVTDSKIELFLATMQRDINSFIRTGRTHDGLVFLDEHGPQYGCGRALARGGRPPTARMARIRSFARAACDHLQRALEDAMVMKAISPAGAATSYRPKLASVKREARLAKAPATKAQTLLDDARIR